MKSANTLGLLAACLLIVGLSLWVLNRPATAGSIEPDVRSPQPAAPAHADLQVGGEPQTSEPEAQQTTLPVPQPARRFAPDPSEAIPPAKKNPPSHLLNYAPTYWLAKELGFDVTGPDAEFLARWFAERQKSNRRHMRGARSGSVDSRRQAMLDYNERTEARRRSLIQRFGRETAIRVLEKYPGYRFVMPRGVYKRIDVDGNEVPFVHDDENIFDELLPAR